MSSDGVGAFAFSFFYPCALRCVIWIMWFPLPFVFSSLHVSRAVVMPYTVVRIIDVDLVCLINTRATALISRGRLSLTAFMCFAALSAQLWTDLCSEGEIRSNSSCSKVGWGLGSYCSIPESIQNKEKGDILVAKDSQILVEGWAASMLLTLLLACVCTAEVVAVQITSTSSSLNWQNLHRMSHNLIRLVQKRWEIVWEEMWILVIASCTSSVVAHQHVVGCLAERIDAF